MSTFGISGHIITATKLEKIKRLKKYFFSKKKKRIKKLGHLGMALWPWGGL
jgi:hypothetical protein